MLGYGVSQLSSIRPPFEWRRNYMKKSTETHKGIQAMDEAISNLSLGCSPANAASALYLLSAPSKEMNMDLVKELGDYLSEIAPEAIIRYGDYPRGGSTLKITVIMSQLNAVDKVKDFYNKMPYLIQDRDERQDKNEARLKELADAAVGVPSLFSSGLN